MIVGLMHLSRSFMTPNDQFFVLQKGAIPNINQEEWSLDITGNIEYKLHYNYEQFTQLESKKEIATLDCVEGYTGTAEWEGVPLIILLNMAGLKEGSYDIVFYATDGYADSLNLREASAENILLAYNMNGVPLPKEQGFPLRLVCPDHYGYKWVKWITKIEVVNYDYIGYWEQRGWSDQAMRTNFSAWIVHAYLFSITFIFAGLSFVSGRKFSGRKTDFIALPNFISKRFHALFSILFFSGALATFIYWVIVTFELRGSIFYSLHGIIGLITMILILIGSFFGIPLLNKTEKGKRYHITLGSYAFYLYSISIIFGIIISLIGTYRLAQIFSL